MTKTVRVKAWLCISDYEEHRNYAYVHFCKKKPQTDTNYKVECCTITYKRASKPRRKK